MKETKEISKTFSNVVLLLNEKEVWGSGTILSLQTSTRIQSLVKKNFYRRKFEKSMTALTFAEPGEFDIDEIITHIIVVCGSILNATFNTEPTTKPAVTVIL